MDYNKLLGAIVPGFENYFQYQYGAILADRANETGKRINSAGLTGGFGGIKKPLCHVDIVNYIACVEVEI
jgi:hypothetical protein